MLDSDVKVINSTIINNQASADQGLVAGGGIALLRLPFEQGRLEMVNCVVAENSTAGDGTIRAGGMYNDGGEMIITNCTIVDNIAVDGTGGAYYEVANTYYEPTLMLSNSILYGNEAATGNTMHLANDDTIVEIRNCDFEGGLAGITGNAEPNVYSNNFDEDPLFVDAPNSDYRLSYLSLCLNKGDTNQLPNDQFDLNNNSIVNETIPYDRDGNGRQINSYLCVDVGAYENQHTGSCLGDITGGTNDEPDNNVNVVDLLHLITRWGTVGGMADLHPSPCGDRVVNVQDLIQLIDHWGTCQTIEDAPMTIQDCHDKCLAGYPGGGNDYWVCVDACIQSLCEQELIDCD